MALIQLEKKSLKFLKFASELFDKIGVAWSTGKDSTLCLYLFRKLRKNFPVIFTDTYHHFPETYQFCDELAQKWDLNLHIAKAKKDKLQQLISDREQCCHYHKTLPFLEKVEELGLDAVIVGIRFDEHPSRSIEKTISKRDTHSRVHPIFYWTWVNVIEYSQLNNIPTHPLYQKGYTSIGCQPCTTISENQDVERSGRSQDKELVMLRLRQLGYF